MGALTTTTEVPDLLGAWASRKQIVVAKPNLVHASIAQKAEMPTGNGTTAKFRKYNALTTTGTVLAPLEETVPPTGEAMSKSDITSTLGQWGNYVTLSDMVEYTVKDPVMRIAVERLGRQAGQVIDKLLCDEVAAGTQVVYADGGANRAALVNTSDILAAGDVKKCVRVLQENDAEVFERMILASTKIDTKPLRPSYVGIVHPHQYFDIEDDSTFVSVANYANQQAVHPAEVGYFNHVRFLSTTHCKVWASGGGSASGVKSTDSSNADVYGTMIFGPNAVGDVPLSGKSLENIMHARGSGGVTDPINQKATAGWKHTGTRVILEDEFMIRLETTATA